MSEILSTEIVYAQGDEKIIADCHRLRAEGFPLDTEFDDVEQIAFHFLLRVTELDPSTGEPTVKSVGTIRGTTPGTYPGINRYKLSRLAVDKNYRKHKFGRLLVEKLHQWIQADAKAANRSAEVECHSQLPAMGFYAKFGYKPEGEQFDEDGAPHQNMAVLLSPSA
ncbi:acyl-CoA N-acyltransferase [Mycena galopus ATCC 62051]|nr:acyl-CoA N-acyltransferase [Mycena galopus ATCC 62051]